MTLFGKPKEEPKTEMKKKEYKPRPQNMVDPDEPETVSIGDKARYGWKQLPSNEQIKEKGVHHHSFDLIAHSDLNGVTYTVSHSSTSENPHNMMGSSYGCGGGRSFDPTNLQEIKEFFDELMEEKKDDLTEPYRTFTKEEREIKYDHHDAYDFFRLIPAKNYFIIMGDELLRMITQTGFDFEKWYTEYKALPDFIAGTKHWDAALETLRLIEQGDKIHTTLENYLKILELDDKENVLKQTKQDVRTKFDEGLKKLEEIDKQIGGIYNGRTNFETDIEFIKKRLMKTMFSETKKEKRKKK